MQILRMAFGTIGYCQSCQALTALGVSLELLKALGIPSQALKGWLDGHAAYHRKRAEEFAAQGQDAWAMAEMATATREEWLPTGEPYKLLLAQATAANTPKPKLRPVVRRDLNSEELALQEFLWVARKRKERNQRLDNKPVLAKLPTEPFAGWK